jgi:hypothetical protein
MLKLLSRGTAIIIFVSAALFSGGRVAAQTTFDGVSEISDQGPVVEGQNSVKAANEITFEKFTSQLRSFISQVNTGQEDLITGIFVSDVLAVNVVQQPTSNPGYISTADSTVTEFSMARDYGTIGMLAHNYLAGDLFFQLEESQTVYLVFGDSSVQKYTIVDILSYQALQPNSPYSNFLNLENSNEYLSAADLFYKVYQQDDALVLQTCIANQGVESWGRLFVIAIPETDAGNS